MADMIETNVVESHVLIQHLHLLYRHSIIKGLSKQLNNSVIQAISWAIEDC